MHPSELTYRIWGEEMGNFIYEKFVRKERK